MLRQTLQTAGALLVVGSAALLTSCAPMTPLAPATLPDPTVEAKVVGTPSQFAAFDKSLQAIIGTEPLGCSVMINGNVSACDVLQASPVPPTATDLTYVFFGAHTYVYEKFGVAFEQVPKQFNPDLPALTYRPAPPVARDCSGLPQPCVNATYCIQYGRCSRTQYPCKKC
jgi:hypothetical protein